MTTKKLTLIAIIDIVCTDDYLIVSVVISKLLKQPWIFALYGLGCRAEVTYILSYLLALFLGPSRADYLPCTLHILRFLRAKGAEPKVNFDTAP